MNEVSRRESSQHYHSHPESSSSSSSSQLIVIDGIQELHRGETLFLAPFLALPWPFLGPARDVDTAGLDVPKAVGSHRGPCAGSSSQGESWNVK
jgi:hypothetical protein